MTLWPYVFVCYSSMFHVACTDDRDVFHFHCTGALKHHQLVCAIHGSVAIWIDQFFLVVASLAMTHHDKTRSNTLDWKPKEVTGAVVGLMDKKSGEVHLSVNLADMCDAEPKKTLTTSALSNTLKAQFWRTPNCLSSEELTTSVKTVQLLTTSEKTVHVESRLHLRRTPCNTLTPFVMTCVWHRALSWCACHS